MTDAAELIDGTATVADMVLSHPECARVFQAHGIDFCCRGGIRLRDACAAADVTEEALLAELNQAVEQRRPGTETPDFRAMRTPVLIAHIVMHHHEHLRRTLPWLRQTAAKIARVHGSREPALIEIAARVEKLSEALLPHLDLEEEVLFPLLMSRGADRAEIEDELATMMDDHLVVGALLKEIRDRSADFSVPDWACNSYRACFAELQHMEADVLRHVHLENHALAPRFRR